MTGGTPVLHQLISCFYRRTACHRQFCFLPGAKSTADVHHVPKPGALQKTAGNYAAIAALAVDRQRNIEINLRWRNPEAIQRPPCGSIDVPGHPFRLTADIEHLDSASRELLLQLLHTDLAKGSKIESRSLPSRDAIFQISAFGFDPNPGQAKASFRQLLRRIGDEHGTRRQTENCPRPGSELSRQRNVDGAGHVADGKLFARPDIERDPTFFQHRL